MCLTGAQKGWAPGLGAIATTAAHPTPRVSALGKHQAPAGILPPAQAPASVPTWCALGTMGQSHLLITTPLLSRRKVKAHMGYVDIKMISASNSHPKEH